MNTHRQNERDPPPSNTAYKSPAKKIRDKTRSNEFRERKGADSMASIKEQLDKNLFFGFSNDAKAFESQLMKSVPQAKVLPISTRSVGITSQALFIKLNQTMRNIPECSVYSMYRVSLAQLENKLLDSSRNQTMSANVDIHHYQAPSLDLDFREAVLSCPLNVNVIANTINAVGNFEYNQTNYYCKIPNNALPNPATITFTNLHRTVRAMSLRGTPREQRVYFYENNPLPGAKWSGVQPPRGRRPHDFVIDPILMNPEDFWPDNYNIHDFNMDINNFNGLLNWIHRKTLKYVNIESRIDYKGPGSKTCLVSNLCTGLRNSDPIVRDNNIIWRETQMPTGLLDDFWSSQTIEDNTMFIGALQLLGEIPPDKEFTPAYLVRNIRNSSQATSHLWVPVFINLLG